MASSNLLCLYCGVVARALGRCRGGGGCGQGAGQRQGCGIRSRVDGGGGGGDVGWPGERKEVETE